jgi:hypothetical protein
LDEQRIWLTAGAAPFGADMASMLKHRPPAPQTRRYAQRPPDRTSSETDERRWRRERWATAGRSATGCASVGRPNRDGRRPRVTRRRLP